MKSNTNWSNRITIAHLDLKKIILIFIIAFFLNSETYPQSNKTGIFPTSSHFITDSLISIPNGEMKRNSLFNTDIIIMKNSNQKMVFNKDSIYGYCMNNICYRFFKGNEYKIDDTSEIYIYTQSILQDEIKGSSIKTLVYFSENEDSEIFPLDIIHLKKIFSSNLSLCLEIEKMFDNCTVLKYDSQNKKYTINIFLEQQLKK